MDVRRFLEGLREGGRLLSLAFECGLRDWERVFHPVVMVGSSGSDLA